MYARASEILGMYRIPVSSKPQMNHEDYVDVNSTQEEENEMAPVSDKQGDNQPILRSADPKVWGPFFWKTLHISAVHYPLQASPLVKERMKGRILAIPYEIPCSTCRPHASAFIESKKDELDKIVSGRHELGKFYTDFHNKVNERYNKPTWTYEQVYAFYGGK